MENNRLIQQNELLNSVLEVSNILNQRRPDLNITIRQLAEVQAVLDNDDLEWIDKTIGYLCHFKCLYDFCPLEFLEGETDQKRWQRWGEMLDRMRNQANLLCNSLKKKNKYSGWPTLKSM